MTTRKQPIVFKTEFKTPENRRASSRAHYYRNREKALEASAKWRRAHQELLNANERVRRKRLRDELVQAYGSICECCGETEPRFLTLEHKKKDGMEHRKSVGGNYPIYVNLKRRGWPKDDYTLLCWNCNCSERYGKPCPHKVKKTICV